MEQRLVVFTHQAQNLWYVSMIQNDENLQYSASVERQYQHAKSLYKRLIAEDDVPALRSGWMFALINTDCSGWESEILPTIHESIPKATAFRELMIETWERDFPGMAFIGTRKFIKGEYGAGKAPKNWAVKFKPENMTKRKVMEKIKMVTLALNEEVPQSVINACYYAIVAPENHGPRSKNFGSYTVENLSTLFRFVRQSLGKDMANAV